MVNKHVRMYFVNKNLAFWKQNSGEMLGDKLMNCSFHH